MANKITVPTSRCWTGSSSPLSCVVGVAERRQLLLLSCALAFGWSCDVPESQKGTREVGALEATSDGVDAQHENSPGSADEGTPNAGATDSTPPPPPLAGPFDSDLRQRDIVAHQAYLLELLQREFRLAPEQAARLRWIFDGAPRLGFGNPRVSEAALSQEECVARWGSRRPSPSSPECGKNMVLVPGRVPEDSVCIDQFEFPNLVCEYPVVWVRASEAASICEVLGKRLCDAHEWEGACAGEVLGVEEEYSHARLPRGIGQEYRRQRRLLMEDWHNRPRELVWAYGKEKDVTRCGMQSSKSRGCDAVTFEKCGTNDYPAGSFPECVSVHGVYDQHGNVAEHMSFALFPEDVGGLGWTEMKGSWFIAAETHPDDCRWRAKNWHTTRITDPNSHNNYHLGFRCCADPRPGP